MFNQMLLDVLRRTNTSTTGSAYDPNMPIPRPGQPTNYQLPPSEVSIGGHLVSPAATAYINRDITGFNTQQPIPGIQQGQGAVPAQAPFVASGPYGRQAASMAGLLAMPTSRPGGGLLGGPKRGFRIPGGK